MSYHNIFVFINAKFLHKYFKNSDLLVRFRIPFLCSISHIYTQKSVIPNRTISSSIIFLSLLKLNLYLSFVRFEGLLLIAIISFSPLLLILLHIKGNVSSIWLKLWQVKRTSSFTIIGTGLKFKTAEKYRVVNYKWLLRI